MSGERNKDSLSISSHVLPWLAGRRTSHGVIFPATTARCVTPQAGANVYGGDWFQRVRFITSETRDATSRQLGGLYGANSSDNNRVSLRLAASGYTLQSEIRATTSTQTVTLATLAPSTAYDLWFVFTHATKGWAVYNAGNPNPLATGTLAGGVATEYDAISSLRYVQLANSFAGSAQFDGALLGFEYGNVALTGAEIALLSRFGWAALPQYVHEGGAGRVLYEYTFAAGTEGWTAYGAPTVSAPSGTLHVTDLGGVFGGANSPSILAALATGKRHLLKFAIKNSLLTDYIRVFASGDGSRFDSSNVRLDGNYALSLVRTDAATGTIRFGNNGAPNPSGTFSLDDVSILSTGLCGSWNFDRNTGFCIPDQSFAGRPIILDATTAWLMPGEDVIRIPIQSLTADDFIQLNQSIVPAGYEVFACALVQDVGVATNAISVKKGSPGGSTLFTGALPGVAGNPVTLTPTPTLFTAADKLHLSGLTGSGATISGAVLARRIK